MSPGVPSLGCARDVFGVPPGLSLELFPRCLQNVPGVSPGLAPGCSRDPEIEKSGDSEIWTSGNQTPGDPDIRKFINLEIRRSRNPETRKLSSESGDPQVRKSDEFNKILQAQSLSTKTDNNRSESITTNPNTSEPNDIN